MILFAKRFKESRLKETETYRAEYNAIIKIPNFSVTSLYVVSLVTSG